MIPAKIQAPLAVLALLCCAQTVLSVDVHEDFSEFSNQIANILRGFERGVNGVRRSGDHLSDTLDRAEDLALDKVNKEYREKLSRFWSQNLSEAISDANKKGVDVSECTSDNIIPGTLDKVVQEAEKEVREKIPQRVPRVREQIKNLNVACDAFMNRAKGVARRCDAMQNYFERSMCMATQLATMGGQIGGLGGQAGNAGGSVAWCIDGTAREAVMASAEHYNVPVKAYSAKATNCIYGKLN